MLTTTPLVQWIAICGCPEHVITRTFTAVFYLPLSTKKHKPKKTYKNPLFLALEWQQIYKDKNFANYTALAKYLQVSKVRVTQIFQLLSLCPEVKKIIMDLGDAMPKPIITERYLRSIIKLNRNKQVAKVQEKLNQ